MSLYVDIEKRLGAFHLRSKLEAQNCTTALLGASGCGKSMTLKCIAGIVAPDRGRIVLNGRILFDSEKKVNLPPQQRRVGYLFQQYALFPNMTVEQNILCGIRGSSKAEKKRILSEKLRMFRLEEMEKKYPVQLSSGQQQRVALARILCSEPEAILLDEPFSALDIFLKWNLEIELSELLADFQGPIIWVSHDRDECYRNCPKVCVMENGVTGAVTDIDDMIHHPATVSAAQLAGCKCFLAAEPCESGVLLPEWGLTLPMETDGKRFTTLAIPDDAVVLGGEIPCTVFRLVPEVERDIVLLQPRQSVADTPLMRLECEKNVRAEEGSDVTIHLQLEKLLLL